MSLAHIYACQVEFISENLNKRDCVLISLHPHNDRGCAVAAAELGLLAGADRIEGTLFGNGERTGNVDLITLALNLHTHGVDSKLDFSDIPSITRLYERVSKMSVYERQPYSGKLVFAAFSGSHQDAIAKGMAYHKEKELKSWSVPYLPIDPKDLGRVYESDVIRINSQSGKGGISYILKEHYKADLPAILKEEFSYHIKDISDKAQKELSPEEICEIFEKDFVNLKSPLEITEYSFSKKENMQVNLSLDFKGEKKSKIAQGNGRLDSVVSALKELLDINFEILDYSEHSLKEGSKSRAISYVYVDFEGEKLFGVGIDEDIIAASIKGLTSAINRVLNKKG